MKLQKYWLLLTLNHFSPTEMFSSSFHKAKKRISRFNCPTCNKLYLGLGRMEKHFLQHPDHGSFEEFKQMLSAPTSSVANATEGGKIEDNTFAIFMFRNYFESH